MVVPRRLRWQAALTHLGRLPRAVERGDQVAGAAGFLFRFIGRGNGPRLHYAVFVSGSEMLILRVIRPASVWAKKAPPGDERIGSLDRLPVAPTSGGPSIGKPSTARPIDSCSRYVLNAPMSVIFEINRDFPYQVPLSFDEAAMEVLD
jgi:hypothetical protein